MINRSVVFALTFVGCLLFNGQVAFAQSQEAGETAFARQALRIDLLETEIRRLTGQNEDLNFKIAQLESQLKLIKERINSALGQIERLQQFRSVAQSVSNGRFEKSSRSPEKVDLSGAVTPVPGAAKGARSLGVLRTEQVEIAKPADPAEELSPQQLYEKAQDFLTKGRELEKAIELLKIFLGRYATHELAPNAYYWLGRAYFVRKEFRKASFSFAEGLQKFPNSPKAPANLYNLGMAFLKLDKKRDACTTWGQLLGAYPKAASAIKMRVERERENAKCF